MKMLEDNPIDSFIDFEDKDYKEDQFITLVNKEGTDAITLSKQLINPDYLLTGQFAMKDDHDILPHITSIPLITQLFRVSTN